MERNYWVVRQGRGGVYAEYAKEHDVIGLGWSELEEDLSKYKSLDQREFVQKVAPRLEEVNPGNTPGNYTRGARQLFHFVGTIRIGDVVLVPTREDGLYHFGIIQSDYYHKDQSTEEFPLQHRRDVKWLIEVHKDSFSQTFRNSAGAIQSVFSLSPHAEEIERLIFSNVPKGSELVDYGELQKEFGMEAHLEDFIVENWTRLSEFDSYEVYQEESESVGKQYVTTIGRIDILARSRECKKWLVIELKKGKSSDDVVGQVLRYIGWVKKNLAQEDEEVKGLIITGAEDERLMYALSTLDHVDFMTYKVSFSLEKR